jgi:hypothetical protein
MTVESTKYPYLLAPTGRFYLRPTPVGNVEETLDFYYKYKRPTENLYIGKIDKTCNIDFEGSGYVLAMLTKYIDDSLFLKEVHRDSDLSIKLIPKLCWLTSSYLEKGLEHPVCIHYNPRIQRNVMHPGATRNHIINLFHGNQPIKCLYFNTGGVEFDFLKTMQIIKKSTLLSYPHISVNIILDHCSTIPHVNLEDKSIVDNITVWGQHLNERFGNSSFKLYMNNQIPFLSRWATEDETVSTRVYIKDLKNKDDLVRAFLLVATGKTYSSPTLRVLA